MYTILLRHNTSMLQQVALLMDTIHSKQVPEELALYKGWLIRTLESMQSVIQNNLKAINKKNSNLYKDILSDTELVFHNLGLVNSLYVPPIHRSISSDIISLKLLHWLHNSNSKTINIPFAIADGSFGVYLNQRTLYYLPIVEQKGLLFLALFFHEFGHVLFAIHRPEMEQLIAEIQLAIEEFLRPGFAHNDEKNEDEWRNNEIIVTTWYRWALELYCDAVGLVIGGPAYLLAFSNYFQMGGRNEFFNNKEELAGSTHPVTSIRLKFLLSRARQLGYNEISNQVEEEWNLLKTSYNVNEEYFGYYIEEYFEVIEGVISDMITQSFPIEYNNSSCSPAVLINQAWQKFYENPAGYPDAEKNLVHNFLNSSFQLSSILS
jgi:hypothetical protein